jgi:hypothetical protein
LVYGWCSGLKKFLFNEVAIDVYLFRKGKGKYHENLDLTWLTNHGGFGSWLREGKILAPLASIVLDGNRLGGLGSSAQDQIKLLYRWLISTSFPKKSKEKVFII